MICLGMPDEREGLFEIIQRAKNHYQKRAYQCIKCLVTLFTKCSSAHNMLNTTLEFRRKWALSVEWLQDELERVIDCLFQLHKMPSPGWQKIYRIMYSLKKLVDPYQKERFRHVCFK